MECYTSSGTFCGTWLFRKASSNTKFPQPESGNWTTGSLSFTTNCNFRSPALWQRQIQVSAPWRIHCALLCEKFWRVMLPKLGEFPKAVSLWQYRAWGAACTTVKGEQCDRSDALDTVMDPVWKPGEWCHSKTSPHSVQCTKKPRLHSEKHSHSSVHSSLWNWIKDSLSNDKKRKKKRKTEKDYNRIFLLIWAIPHVRSAQNLSADQLQWLFSIWQGNDLCLLFSLPHLLVLSLLSW